MTQFTGKTLPQLIKLAKYRDKWKLVAQEILLSQEV